MNSTLKTILFYPMTTEQYTYILEKLDIVEALLRRVLSHMEHDTESVGSVQGQNYKTTEETTTTEVQTRTPYVFDRTHLTNVSLRTVGVGYSLSDETYVRQETLRKAMAPFSVEKVYTHLQALHYLWKKNLEYRVKNSQRYVDALSEDITFLEANYM